MSYLFDTNVILDVLLDRLPFAEPAAILLARAERGEIQGFACATTVTTVFYLARKAVGRELARGQVGDLLSILNVVRSIERYWSAPPKAKSAISRMPSSSSPRGKCRCGPFSLATREILRSHRFRFTPR